MRPGEKDGLGRLSMEELEKRLKDKIIELEKDIELGIGDFEENQGGIAWLQWVLSLTKKPN